MENDIQKLYDVLSRDGYYTKSFQEFTKQFEDDSYKQKVYDATSRDGLYTKSYEEFISKYSLKKKDVSEVSTSGLEPGVSVSGETDDIFKNDYLLGIREGSIKKDSGEIFNSSEVIDAAKEQGYSQEDIDKMMIKTSSDPTLSKEVVKEPKVEEVPSDLEEKIYQGIYGKALEQGDTSVPTIEQWKENPDLYTGMTSGEATEEAFEMMTDPERADQAVEDIINTTIIPALKNVEHAYDETFIGDAIRTISMGNNKELKQLQIDKKKEKIQVDTTLTEEQKENKIEELNSDGFVWASEPFVNLTGYTPEETNEFAVGIMSTVGDFMLTPGAGLLGQAGKLVPKVLTSKILLKTGKATQEVLTKLFKMSPDVASKIVQKQLPEFLRRADIAGTKFGTFNIYKDFQQQVDEYGGVENIDFSQSDEAFTEGYGLGVLLGTVGSVSRALPRAAQAVKEAGVKGVAQRGVTDVLSGISPDKSVLIGRLGEGLAFTTEVGTFGLINATTPTLKNPEGELTTESFLDGSAEAFKTVIGFRAAGIVRNLMTPTTKDFKFEYDFNKSEKQKASDLVKEIGFKVEEGNLNPKEYLKDVIAKKKAPISVIDRVLQELSGMKSTLTRDNILKKVFKVEVQAKSDGTFDLNTYNKEGNWLTTRNVTNVGEARESIESFNQERLEAPQGAYEPNVEVVMNLDPIQDIISPPTMQFKIPRIDESPIDSPKPVLFNQPNPEAAEISSSYIEQRKDELGLVKPEAEKVESLDIENSKRIADAYDELVDNPTDPAVKSAYDAMAKETLEQYASILDKGYKIEIWEGEGEPYKNSSEMIADVRDNKHMYIFGTEAGYGDREITPENRAENAMLSETEYKDVTGKTLLVNDVFRFVHDFFGHTELGNGFGPIGEENAWMVHSRMYSPEARRAMTTETRGQNSWVNFNKGLRRDDGSMPTISDKEFVKNSIFKDKLLHGTETAFNEFAEDKKDLKFRGKGVAEIAAQGRAKVTFFSKESELASQYANQDPDNPSPGARIIESYLDVRNPFDITDKSTWGALIESGLFAKASTLNQMLNNNNFEGVVQGKDTFEGLDFLISKLSEKDKAIAKELLKNSNNVSFSEHTRIILEILKIQGELPIQEGREFVDKNGKPYLYNAGGAGNNWSMLENFIEDGTSLAISVLGKKSQKPYKGLRSLGYDAVINKESGFTNVGVFNASQIKTVGSMPKRGDADYIPLSQRPFAEQKMGLLPDDVTFPEGAPVKAQAPVEAELGELEFYRAGKTDPKDLDPEMAKDFAKAVFLSKDKDFVQGWDKNKKYGEGDIKRIKIDIKNPFDTNNPDTWDAALKNKIFTRKQLETLRDRGEYLMEVDGVPEANYMQPTEENNWLIIEQKGEALKNAGYDSFYVYEKGARNVGVFNKGVYSEVTEAPVSEPTTDVPEIKIPETRYNDPKEIERIGFETGGIAHIPTDFMLNFLHVGEKRVKQYTGEEIDLEIKELKESLEGGGVDVSKDIQYSPNRLEATRMIVNSIRKDGFTGEENNIQKGPILLEIDSKGFARIGQGNHRLLAAKALGMDKVPVTVQFSEFSDNTPRVNKIKVISDSKIKELESIAKKRRYQTKYASIWLTDLVKDNFIENNPVDLNKNLEGGYNLNEVISKITEAPAEVVPVEVKPSASLPIQPTEADAKMIEDMKAQGLPPLEIVLGLQESYIKQLPEGQPPMNEVALRQKAELILEGHENPEMTEDYFDMAAEMSKGKKGNIYDVINYLKKEAGRKLKKNFKPEGAMPRDAYTKDEFRVGAINKEIKQAEFNIRKLKKAVDKYNKANPDNQITYNDLNEYLSSYKYGIDPASRKGEVRGDSPRFSMESDFLSTSDVIVEKSFATKEARDEYLKGKDISKYDLKEKKLSEGTSRFYTYYRPEVLPDDIRIPLNKIRFHIDGMSNQLVEQGIVSEKLALTISSNLGSYIHRTFDAFEKGSDRSYEWVRENEPNNFKLAANYFRRRVAPEVRKENPDLKGTELNKAIIDRVETEMKLALSPDSKFNMLNQLEKQFKEGVNRSILDGQKDVSALKTRQFVPDDLRGYLGEVGNINNNYLESTLAIARILHNHQYQSALKEMFSGKVFFDNAVDVPKDMLKGDEAPVQMETTNQDIVDPLAGMWTTPEMKEAFSGDYAQMSGIVSKALAGAIGIHKVTQTIMSYPSHAVNFFGNLGYLAANDVFTYKMKSTGKAMLESAKASWVTMGGEPSPELEENYLEYVEMGIVGTSASAKDILKYVGDSQMITENPELYGSLKTKESVKTLGDLAKYPGKGLEALAKLWGAEDDFFKIIGYEVAKDKRLDIYMRNGMSEVEAKRKIADEVKSEMPTFSRLPKAFRDVKGVRIVGTWLTYPVISLYSQIGTFSNAVDLVRNGKKWNEPELEKQGRRKAATGMGFVGLASLLGASISAMFGEEDEEDYDNARFFVRDYQQDSDIFVSEAYGTRNSRGKIDGGKMVYYDFGASNPYGSTQKIMNIWLDRFESIDEISAEEEEKMLKEMFNEVGKNLEKSAKALGIDADPVTATVLEALTGFDGYGKRLYEVEDKLLDKAGKGLSHILKRTMTPGSIRYAKKLTEAEDVKSESLAQATGVKRREVNLLDEMQYASFKFGSDFYQARKELRKKMRQVSKGEMTMDEYKSIAEEKSAFLKDRVAQMHAMYMGAQSLMLKGDDGIRSSDKQDIMDTNTALQRKMILEGGLSREVVKRFILPNDYYDIISRVETEDSFDVLSKKRLKTLEKELGE